MTNTEDYNNKIDIVGERRVLDRNTEDLFSVIEEAYMALIEQSSKFDHGVPSLNAIVNLLLATGKTQRFEITSQHLAGEVLEYMGYNKHVCWAFDQVLYDCQEELISDTDFGKEHLWMEENND